MPQDSDTITSQTATATTDEKGDDKGESPAKQPVTDKTADGLQCTLYEITANAPLPDDMHLPVCAFYTDQLVQTQRFKLTVGNRDITKAFALTDLEQKGERALYRIHFYDTGSMKIVYPTTMSRKTYHHTLFFNATTEPVVLHTAIRNADGKSDAENKTVVGQRFFIETVPMPKYNSIVKVVTYVRHACLADDDALVALIDTGSGDQQQQKPKKRPTVNSTTKDVVSVDTRVITLGLVYETEKPSGKCAIQGVSAMRKDLVKRGVIPSYRVDTQ